MSKTQIEELQPGLLSLIGEIYDAGIDPARWSDVVSSAARVMGGSASLVYGLEDPRIHGGWFGHRFPSSAMESYGAHYRHTNLWAHEIDRRRVAVGAPVLTDALVDTQALERSEFYVDYLRELDIQRACTVLLHKDASTSAESHLCIYRSRSHSPFDARAQRVMQLLVPHFQRAQRVGRVLADLDSRSRTAFAAIDGLSVGIAMFSSLGTVLHLNPAAEIIVKERDGLWVDRGRLCALRVGDSRALDRLVNQAVQRHRRPVGGAAQIYRASGRPPLSLVVSPLSEHGIWLVGGDSTAMAMGLVSGHEGQLRDARELLPQVYGLTPAETRIAIGLLDGLTVKEIAHAGGTSLNTAKTQLAGLFAKTGTHRQGEAIALLRAACGHLQSSE